MPARNPIQQFQQGNFRGGLNTSRPPNEIADDEAVDLLNYEFDWDGNLVTRNGVTQFNSGQTYTTRITSLHDYVSESGAHLILYTQSNKLFKANPDGTGTTDITASLTFPSNTFWMWRTFKGLAIGCNRASSGTNPVKVDNTGTAAQLGGTPPKGSFLEVWNERLWVTGISSAPNQVRASALGNVEDWTTAGAAGTISLDIDPDDGDIITGLIAFKNRLFVFKRKRIYVLSQGGDPFTFDGQKIIRTLFNKNIGCVSAYTIQNTLDDVLFLAEGGVASLTSAEIVADFTSALISRNIQEIARAKKTSDEFASMVLSDVSQYWLSIPANLSATGAAVTYVLDYSDLAQRIVRWMRFDGLMTGTAFTDYISPTGRAYLIGAQKAASDFRVFKYIPRNTTATYSDDGAAYNKTLKSKAYDLGSSLLNKQFFKFGVGFRLINSPVAVSIQYLFDQSQGRSGSYGLNLEAETQQSLWGPGGMVWGDNWAGGNEPVDVEVWKTFITSKDGPSQPLAQFDVDLFDDEFFDNVFIPQITVGDKGANLTFVISNGQVGQAFLIKDLAFFYAFLGELDVGDF